MQVYENQTFTGLKDRNSGRTISSIECRRCCFESCSLSNTHSPELRTIVCHSRFIDCSQTGCYVHAAIFEDVLVDGLKTTSNGVITGGAVFKHVVLRGRIENLMISNLVFAGTGPSHEQVTFDRANAAYYRHVDWALDISEGEFRDLEIRGVPTRLVRRDPETQIIVTREGARASGWRDLPFRSQTTITCLEWFLDRDDPDYILIAPKRSPCFRDRLADIRLLRTSGIAKPD